MAKLNLAGNSLTSFPFVNADFLNILSLENNMLSQFDPNSVLIM